MPVQTNSVFDTIFGHNDYVLMTAFIVMLIMSVASWTVIIYRIISGIRMRSSIKAHTAVYYRQDGKSLQDRLADMQGKSPIKNLVNLALSSKADCQDEATVSNVSYADDLMSNIRHGLDESAHRMDGGLTLLASIGATAPFVGLFGTVWGIYHALLNIASMGSVNIATISAPIGEALIATAFGLFVAIPAVLAYNALNRSNRVLQRRLDAFAHQLYRYCLHQ